MCLFLHFFKPVKSSVNSHSCTSKVKRWQMEDWRECDTRSVQSFIFSSFNQYHVVTLLKGKQRLCPHHRLTDTNIQKHLFPLLNRTNQTSNIMCCLSFIISPACLYEWTFSPFWLKNCKDLCSYINIKYIHPKYLSLARSGDWWRNFLKTIFKAKEATCKTALLASCT